MLSTSIDIKRLTYDLIDVLKDIIIYKNTEDINILFVLSKKDIDNLAPYILVEEAFEIIDILIDASSHYSLSLDANTYFELAMLKICNKVKGENKSDIETEIIVDTINKVNHINELEKDSEIVEKKNLDEVDQTKCEIEEVTEGTIESVIKNNESETNTLDNTISTNKKEEKLKTNIEILFDDILNILVQADRKILNEIKEKWPVIARYRFNLNTAKYASMLCDGIPVAAAKGGIIIAFEHQPNVNEINDTENYYQLKNFLQEILGYSYDFIAVKNSEWPNMRNRYIEMNRSKTLPQAQPIVLHHIGVFQSNNEELNEAQTLALELFGEIVEFEE